MREEQQIRERVDRLQRENETLRQQCAMAILADKRHDAHDILARIAHNETAIRSLDWALGGKA